MKVCSRQTWRCSWLSEAFILERDSERLIAHGTSQGQLRPPKAVVLATGSSMYLPGRPASFGEVELAAPESR